MDLNVGITSSQTHRKESDVTIIQTFRRAFPTSWRKKAAGIYTVAVGHEKEATYFCL